MAQFPLAGFEEYADILRAWTVIKDQGLQESQVPAAGMQQRELLGYHVCSKITESVFRHRRAVYIGF